MSIFRIGVVFIYLLTTAIFSVKAQQFFTGSLGTTTNISRTGSTTLGFALFRSTPNGTQVLEHVENQGDLYIRSVAYQVPNDEGNIIINDIGGFVGIGTSKPKHPG